MWDKLAAYLSRENPALARELLDELKAIDRRYEEQQTVLNALRDEIDSIETRVVSVEKHRDELNASLDGMIHRLTLMEKDLRNLAKPISALPDMQRSLAFIEHHLESGALAMKMRREGNDDAGS